MPPPTLPPPGRRLLRGRRAFRFVMTLGLLLACLPASPAAESTLLHDTFSDGERGVQNLPDSAAWFVGTLLPGALAVTDGALQLSVANASRVAWAYFPLVSLRVGEAITVTCEFSLTAPVIPGGSFRFGLCHTNGVPVRTSDASLPGGPYQGYCASDTLSAIGPRRLGKRNGPASSDSSAPLLSSFGTGADTIWQQMGTSALRGASQANTAYTMVLRVARTGADSASVTTSLTGGGLDGTNTLTVADTAGAFTSFDLIAIAFTSGTHPGDLRITRVSVTTTAVAAITNLSILANLTPADPAFTVGTVVGGPGTGGAKALLVRAAGPSLAALGVNGAVSDPQLAIYSGQTLVAANDDWGGTDALGAAFRQVGAFPFQAPTSRDGAIFNPALPAGGYTIQVSGVAGATGTVIAELYDATPGTSITATTPRLVNVSVLKPVGAGESLTAGFVIGGTGAKQVLVRAVGPALGGAPFNVPGAMLDPRLELFSGSRPILANDDWGGGDALAAAFTRVGAFALPVASRDAALLVSLPPGNYTAQVVGNGGSGGTVLVEVYEVP